MASKSNLATDGLESGQPPALAAFDFDPRTRVIFGTGTSARLGEIAAELGGRRVLLVTDKGLAAAGHEQRGIDSLRAAGLDVAVFDEVHPNPTTDDVDRAVEFARGHQIDLIVGLGGGSSMDCAKGANFLLTNGGRMQDYWGVGKATKPMLPMIAVPTTAGTGSEAQSFAVIADSKTHMKMACGDKKAACRVAILDPDITLTMPPKVTAVTGIDAISHAVETYVTTKRNPVSQVLSRQAWNLLARSFPRLLSVPDDIAARGGMLLGAHLAGAAIENSMLGATHALANPLTAHLDMTHGVAIGVMLPHVIRFNSVTEADRYGELASDVDLCSPNADNASELLAEFVTRLVAEAGSPTSLTEAGVTESLLPQLATEAAQQWTGRFNPRPVDATALQELYQGAMSDGTT